LRAACAWAAGISERLRFHLTTKKPVFLRTSFNDFFNKSGVDLLDGNGWDHPGAGYKVAGNKKFR